MLLDPSSPLLCPPYPPGSALLPHTFTQLYLTLHDRDEGSCHRAWLASHVYRPDAGILVADSWDTVANAPAGSCA